MPPKKRKITPHPSGMAQPPMSKRERENEKRREVAKKFFDSAEARNLKAWDMSTPSIRGALDKVPKTTSVGLSEKGELLINDHSREEFHAHGCPFEFRNPRFDDDSWTVDGCVGEGDDEGGWYFEGTLTENTVKGKTGGRKCDIECYWYTGKKNFYTGKKAKFTLTNLMRNGVISKEKIAGKDVKEKVVDFIMWEDHEHLKQTIIDEVFCYYS